MKILIINGPNLNLLGKREPEIYGNRSFEEFFEELQTKFKEVELSFFQSNSEGELITTIQQAAGNFEGLIINAAAFTHTSVAIADALRFLDIPIIEVHISNVFEREEFRHKSYISAVADGIIIGLGLKGYELAIRSIRDPKV